jgi:hypothetical protein
LSADQQEPPMSYTSSALSAPSAVSRIETKAQISISSGLPHVGQR